MQLQDFHKRLHPTIAQYQQLVLLAQDDQVNGYDREIRFAAIMSKLTYQDAEETLSIKDILDINRRWQFPDMAAVVPRLPRRVWIQGRLYRIAPEFNKLMAGEFTSFEHLTRTPDNAVREMHYVMALLIRPYRIPYLWRAKKKESSATYLTRANYLQDHAPAWIGCMISAFFLQVWRQLSDPTYSRQNGIAKRKATH